MSNKKGKIVLFKQGLFIFVVLFCETEVDLMPRLANFSPCNRLIFCFVLLPTLYAHSLLKNDVFFKCSWVFTLKGPGKEKSSG